MPTCRLPIFLLVLFTAPLLPGKAEEGPPAVTEYLGRTVAQTMHFAGAPWLIRENREEEENGRLMLEELRIRPGMVICDLGCGNGYHSLEMARRAAPDGKVLGVDVQQEMLDMLVTRAAAENIPNITPIRGKYWDPNLPPGSCDLILLVDVYHEFSHPAQMLAAMHRALKPGGQVALVEYRAEDDTVPIKPEHKMTRAQIMKEWLPAGFALEREFQGLPWQHLLFFRQRRTGEPDAPPPPLTIHKKEAWTLTGEETHRCTHLRIDGDLTLKTGALLRLEDCTLEITGGHSLRLENGGLITRRSTLTGNPGSPVGMRIGTGEWSALSTTISHNTGITWEPEATGSLTAQRLLAGTATGPLTPSGKATITLKNSTFPLNIPGALLPAGKVPDQSPGADVSWKLTLQNHTQP